MIMINRMQHLRRVSTILISTTTRTSKSRSWKISQMLCTIIAFLAIANGAASIEEHQAAFVQTEDELHYFGDVQQMQDGGFSAQSAFIKSANAVDASVNNQNRGGGVGGGGAGGRRRSGGGGGVGGGGGGGGEDDTLALNQLKFDPTILKFGQNSIGIPQLAKVTVTNPTASKVRFDAISGSTVHFHCSFFEEKNIEPGGSTTFDVVFLARAEGTFENTLFIHSSLGTFTYSVIGVGVPNAYRLRPIVGAKVPVNGTLISPLEIHNPHPTTLKVTEMYASGANLHLELPNIPGANHGNQETWEIPPYQTKTVMQAKFIGAREKNTTAYIRIKTGFVLSIPLKFDPGPPSDSVSSAPTSSVDGSGESSSTTWATEGGVGVSAGVVSGGSGDSFVWSAAMDDTWPDAIVLPVEVEVTSKKGLYSTVDILDYGIVRDDNPSRVIDIHIVSTVNRSVEIESIVTDPPNPALHINYIRPMIVKTLGDPRKNVKLARSTFWAVDNSSEKPRRDIIKGLIRITSKGGQYKLAIPYIITVIRGKIGHNLEETSFYSGNEPPLLQNVTINNTYPFPLAVYNVSLPKQVRDAFQAKLLRNPVIMAPGESKHVFSLRYNGGLPPPVTSFARILTNVSKFDIPIHVFDGKLRMTLYSIEQSQFDFGTLDVGEKRSILFAVTNTNPVGIPLNQLRHVMDSYTHLKLIGVELGNETILADPHNQSDYNWEPGMDFVVPARSFAVFEYSVIAPNDRAVYHSSMTFQTPYEVKYYPVSFYIEEGTMVSIPDRITFPDAFPGKMSQQRLQVYSTYPRDMPLLRLSTLGHDPRIFFESFDQTDPSPVIKNGQMSFLGRVFFFPIAGCMEDCYVGMPLHTNAGKWFVYGMRLPPNLAEIDVYLYEQQRLKWKAIRDKGEHVVNSTIVVDSTEVKHFQIPAQGRLVWPRLMKQSAVHFPLTAVGNFTILNLTLQNPSSLPVVVQLLPLTIYPDPELLIELLKGDFPDPLTDNVEYNETLMFTLRDTELFNLPKDSPVPKFRQELEEVLDGMSIPRFTLSMILPPGWKVRVRLGFLPKDYEMRSSLLLIRNNLTVLEPVTLYGRGARTGMKINNRLPGRHSRPLLIELKDEHLADCSNPRRQTHKTHTSLTVWHPFFMVNTGEVPFTVIGMNISNQACENHGFRILNCEQFHLKPNQSREIKIAFTADFTSEWTEAVLQIYIWGNGSGTLYPLAASIPGEWLPICHKALPRHPWEPIFYYIALCLIIFCTICCVAMAFIEGDRIIIEAFRREKVRLRDLPRFDLNPRSSKVAATVAAAKAAVNNNSNKMSDNNHHNNRSRSNHNHNNNNNNGRGGNHNNNNNNNNNGFNHNNNKNETDYGGGSINIHHGGHHHPRGLLTVFADLYKFMFGWFPSASTTSTMSSNNNNNGLRRLPAEEDQSMSAAGDVPPPDPSASTNNNDNTAEVGAAGAAVKAENMIDNSGGTGSLTHRNPLSKLKQQQQQQQGEQQPSSTRTTPSSSVSSAAGGGGGDSSRRHQHHQSNSGKQQQQQQNQYQHQKLSGKSSNASSGGGGGNRKSDSNNRQQQQLGLQQAVSDYLIGSDDSWEVVEKPSRQSGNNKDQHHRGKDNNKDKDSDRQSSDAEAAKISQSASAGAGGAGGGRYDINERNIVLRKNNNNGKTPAANKSQAAGGKHGKLSQTKSDADSISSKDEPTNINNKTNINKNLSDDSRDERSSSLSGVGGSGGGLLPPRPTISCSLTTEPTDPHSSPYQQQQQQHQSDGALSDRSGAGSIGGKSQQQKRGSKGKILQSNSTKEDPTRSASGNESRKSPSPYNYVAQLTADVVKKTSKSGGSGGSGAGSGLSAVGSPYGSESEDSAIPEWDSVSVGQTDAMNYDEEFTALSSKTQLLSAKMTEQQQSPSDLDESGGGGAALLSTPVSRHGRGQLKKGVGKGGGMIGGGGGKNDLLTSSSRSNSSSSLASSSSSPSNEDKVVGVPKRRRPHTLQTPGSGIGGVGGIGGGGGGKNGESSSSGQSPPVSSSGLIGSGSGGSGRRSFPRSPIGGSGSSKSSHHRHHRDHAKTPGSSASSKLPAAQPGSLFLPTADQLSAQVAAQQQLISPPPGLTSPPAGTPMTPELSSAGWAPPGGVLGSSLLSRAAVGGMPSSTAVAGGVGGGSASGAGGASKELSYMQKLQIERKQRLEQYKRETGIKAIEEEWPGINLQPPNPAETLWDKEKEPWSLFGGGSSSILGAITGGTGSGAAGGGLLGTATSAGGTVVSNSPWGPSVVEGTPPRPLLMDSSASPFATSIAESVLTSTTPSAAAAAAAARAGFVTAKTSKSADSKPDVGSAAIATTTSSGGGSTSKKKGKNKNKGGHQDNGGKSSAAKPANFKLNPAAAPFKPVVSEHSALQTTNSSDGSQNSSPKPSMVAASAPSNTKQHGTPKRAKKIPPSFEDPSILQWKESSAAASNTCPGAPNSSPQDSPRLPQDLAGGSSLFSVAPTIWDPTPAHTGSGGGATSSISAGWPTNFKSDEMNVSHDAGIFAKGLEDCLGSLIPDLDNPMETNLPGPPGLGPPKLFPASANLLLSGGLGGLTDPATAASGSTGLNNTKPGKKERKPKKPRGSPKKQKKA